MKIGGVQKLSLIDYPGKTSAVIFTIGCNFRCKFCHNPTLVLPQKYVSAIPDQEVLDFFASRVGKLQGIVISGGEPTLHKDLPDFIRKIKKMGFLVKLDTNGTNLPMMKKLFGDNLLDYVAMDIKCAPENYAKTMGWAIDPQIIRDSIKMIKQSGVNHEFRTTIVKSLISKNEFDVIGQLIKGSPRFALQKFRPGLTLDPSFFREETYSDAELENLRQKMEQKYVDKCVVH